LTVSYLSTSNENIIYNEIRTQTKTNITTNLTQVLNLRILLNICYLHNEKNCNNDNNDNDDDDDGFEIAQKLCVQHNNM